MLSTFAQSLDHAGAVAVSIGSSAGIRIDDVAPQYSVDQEGEFARGGGNGGGLAGARGEAAVEGALLQAAACSSSPLLP